MINIVIFGAPGAGKGTQACKIADRYHFTHISTGEVIRAEIAAKTPFGQTVEQAIARGELAPDSVVIEIVKNYMLSRGGHSRGNIFDGFPRTIPQAEAFDGILAGLGFKIDLMLDLVVPEEELVQRILARGRESGRADDADESVIRNRIAVYHTRTAAVADYYKAHGKYVAIDGSRSIETNFEAICAEIDKIIAAK